MPCRPPPQVTVLLPRQDATFCLVGDTRRCYGCGELFEREALMRCAQCKVAYYCTRACQRRHWAAHRAPCLQNQQYPKKWRRMVEACDTAYRMLVRLDSCTLDDDPRRFFALRFTARLPLRFHQKTDTIVPACEGLGFLV